MISAPTHNLNVTKEIILSAGAANSPQILLLSGIGPKDVLSSVNIPVVVENDAVGKNMQVMRSCHELPLDDLTTLC